MIKKQKTLSAVQSSVEQLKKGSQKEFRIDSKLVEKLVKNIRQRSEDHSLANKDPKVQTKRNIVDRSQNSQAMLDHLMTDLP